MSANYWKPNTTVAAVIEQDGKFLMIEERTREGLRINQPAGHLDPGESLLTAVAREALEETAHFVEPRWLIGVYMSRYLYQETNTDVTYLRFTYACQSIGLDNGRDLDIGIMKAFWMTPAQILADKARHRSPLVMRSVIDYLAGKRFPLDLVFTHDSCIYQSV